MPFNDLWQEDDDEELTQQYLTAHEDLDNNPVRFGDGLSFDETRGSQISEQEELEQIQQRNQELKQQQEEHFQRLQQAKRELEEEKRQHIQWQKENALKEQKEIRDNIEGITREVNRNFREMESLEQRRVKTEPLSPTKRTIEPEESDDEEANNTAIPPKTWMGRSRYRADTPRPTRENPVEPRIREYRSEGLSDNPERRHIDTNPGDGGGGDDDGDDNGENEDQNDIPEPRRPVNRRRDEGPHPQNVYIQNSTLKLPQPKNFTGSKPKVAEWLFSLEAFFEASAT